MEMFWLGACLFAIIVLLIAFVFAVSVDEEDDRFSPLREDEDPSDRW